ncbi:aminotransferase class IV family protein [Streptomyces anulatus]|uniref:aminotransferase class IV family protein n=1 Tax=Streptomyces anulatus TaxID=1892 RepID=UPI00340BC8DF|nr:aminotransferase class IV family protein [Streptomyces anulatus]
MLGAMVTLDGKPVSVDDLLPLALTNVGHFTSMRVDADSSIRGLTLHLERLARDCEIVWHAPLNADHVREYVRHAVDGQTLPCVVRVTVFDPKIEMGHPADANEPHVLVSVRGAGALPPAAMRAQSLVYERDLPRVKHIGLFGALHARGAAQRADFDDALFVGRDGFVSEGGTWNVAFVDQEGTVVWPDAPVLPGVTMALLQQQAEHRTATVTLDQAKGMAAAFATNTSIGVRPLAAIDDTEFPVDHPVLRQLQEAYLSIPGETL